METVLKKSSTKHKQGRKEASYTSHTPFRGSSSYESNSSSWGLQKPKFKLSHSRSARGSRGSCSSRFQQPSYNRHGGKQSFFLKFNKGTLSQHPSTSTTHAEHPGKHKTRSPCGKKPIKKHIRKFSISRKNKIFYSKLENADSRQNILETVPGWKIPLLQKPVQKSEPKPIKFSNEEKILMNKEVQGLLAKEAIAPAKSQPNQFLSNIFLTTKRDGRYRPVVNLRNLNKIIPYHKFKLESMKQLKQLLQKGDLFVKIDLQDAYFVIPLHRQS